MSFVIFPPQQGGGGGGEGGVEAPVKSVNGKTGHVFLTHRDINAIRNLQSTIGGIMAGSMKDLPRTPEAGTIFISTDKTPNSIYLYNRNKWENIGGGEEQELEAIAIKFDTSKGHTSSKNVQGALDDAFYQIIANEKDFTIELDKINRELALLDKSDGKIKLTEYDKLDFLSKKISSTLAVENNILTVKGIDGLMSTITELNSLKGIKGNVQKQLDKLSNISGLERTVDTYKELMELDVSRFDVNDLVIVLEDETKDGSSVMYMLDKSKQWLYVGAYDISVELRDFEINPIKLDKEVEGILSESKIDKVLVRRGELEELKEAVLLDNTDDLPEGETNKYYSQNKVDNSINTNRKVSESYSKMHDHFNKTVVDELGETEGGVLTFRGAVVGGGEGGEVPPTTNSDGRVKISANDVLGYLGTKIDNKTIMTNGEKIEARSLLGMVADIDEINKLVGVRDNIQEQLDNQIGKIKLDRYDELGYLGQKIDGNTIVIEDGKLLANRLNGQIVSIGEINYSKGLKGNIQEQIDDLTKIGSFTEVVDKHGDLSNINNPTNGDLALVSSDETHEDETTFYMYDKGEWVYAGNFHIEIRNFKTNPIDLKDESTGVLEESRIDERIARKTDLDDIKIDDTDDLPEGERNKYYNDSLVSSNVDVKENTKQRHNHNNEEVLDGLTDRQGRLIYNGSEISVEGEVLWEDF